MLTLTLSRRKLAGQEPPAKPRSAARQAWKGRALAKNTGNGHRRGSVNDRTQVRNPKTDQYVKRDTDTGRFMNVKQDGEPHKGVAKEPDGRRD